MDSAITIGRIYLALHVPLTKSNIYFECRDRRADRSLSASFLATLLDSGGGECGEKCG